MMKTGLGLVGLICAWGAGCGGPPADEPEGQVAALTAADGDDDDDHDRREPVDLGRQALATNDGWASTGVGTTGGSLSRSTS